MGFSTTNCASVEKVSVKTLIATALAFKSYPPSTDVLLYVSFPATYFKKGRLSVLKKALIASLSLESVNFARSVPFKIKKELHCLRPLFEGFPLLKVNCRLSSTSNLIEQEQFTLKNFPFLRVVALNIGSTFYAPEVLSYWVNNFNSDLGQINPLWRLLIQIQNVCCYYSDVQSLALSSIPPLHAYGYAILCNIVALLLRNRHVSSEKELLGAATNEK